MIGTRLGAYEIVEEIGLGGMATVYRAYQPSISRFVAVKVIHRAIATDSRALERFQREARLIARLEHPHLLPVYDFDGLNDPPYIVMRYVEGGTLKDVLDRSGALPIADTVHILQQVALALDYAHRQGVIHRDIKPSNIMIDGDGNIFLTDFGIARLAAGGGDGITQTGIAVGTPGYMAPEQGLGADNVDKRADIYSMGVMLFQMLSGNMPFTAETPMGVMMKHITEPVPSILDFNPGLPGKIEDILTKALAKNPDDRYQTSGELVEAIAQSGVDTSARPRVIQQVARENVTKIRQQQAEKRGQLDHTMAEFEQSRAIPATPTPPAKPMSLTPLPLPAWTPQNEDSPTILTPTDQRVAAGGIPAPMQAAPAAARSSRLPLVLIAGGAVALILVVVVASRGGASTPTPGAQIALQSSSATSTETPTVPTTVPVIASTVVPTPATPVAFTGRDLSVRAGPGSQYPAIGTLHANDRVAILGISEDGSWFKVLMPAGFEAWLAISSFVSTAGDISVVAFVSGPSDTPVSAPTLTVALTPAATTGAVALAATATVPSTSSATPSHTATSTATVTATTAPTLTATTRAVALVATTAPTSTPSATPTDTATLTFTPSDTATNTATPTFTAPPATNTPTDTPSDTATNTATLTFTPSDTATNSATPTFTAPPATNTPTDTATNTATLTFTPSDTATNTPTETFTPSDTPTETATLTFTPSDTPTDTPTNTPTPTESFTPTDTPTDTATPTETPTETFTPTETLTETSTPTFTLTDTATNTPTVTPTFTPTPTPIPSDAVPFVQAQQAIAQRAPALGVRDLQFEFDPNDGNESLWQNTVGAYQTDSAGSGAHQNFLRMTYTGLPTWQMINPSVGQNLFGVGSDSVAFSDSTNVDAAVDIRLGDGGVGWLGIRTQPFDFGSDLTSYRLVLQRNADGTITVTASEVSVAQRDDVASLTLSGSQPEWIHVEAVSLGDKIGFFVEGQFIGMITNTQQLGGTVALGVDAGTVDFDSLTIHDAKP